MRARLLRLQSQRFANCLGRFIQPPHFPQRSAEIVPRIGVIRFKLDRALILFHCRFVLPSIAKNRTQAVMKRRLQRFQLNRPLKRGDGFFPLSDQPRKLTQVGMKLRDLRMRPRRFGRPLGRHRELPLQPRQDTENRQRPRITRLLLKNLLADAFSLAEPAGALVLVHHSKRVLDRHSLHQSQY